MHKHLILLIAILPIIHSCYEIGGKDTLFSNSLTTTSSPAGESLASQVIEELKSSLSSFLSFRVHRNQDQQPKRITLSLQDLELLIQGAENSISENNLENSENLILILPKIAEGAQRSIKGITPVEDGDSRTMSLVGKIGASMIKSINGRSQYLLDVSAKTNPSPLETALSGVTQVSISNLDEAGLPVTLVAMASKSVVGSLVGSLDDGGLSKSEIGGALKNITSKAVDSLDQIEGVSPTEVTSSLKEITAGATSALDEIEISDYSATDLGDMVQEISSGATEALGNIEMEGISSDNLSSMMEKVTAGATGALGQISMEGYSAKNLSSMLGKITSGATSALGDIEMDGYDSSKLGEMVEKITAGATSALDEIEMTGYSSDNLSSMVEKITSGATGALDEIKMTGFNPATDIFSVTEKVILGTTGALGEIEMEGYDSDDLEGMLEGVTSGATSAINNLQSAGLDQNSLPVMMKSISTSASKGLRKLENTKMLDNASKLPGLMNSITSSTVKGAKYLTVQGFDPQDSSILGSIIKEVISGATESIEEMTLANDSQFDLKKTLSQIATGAISGAKKISSNNAINEEIKTKALEALEVAAEANSVVIDDLDTTPPVLISTIPEDAASNFFIKGLDAWTEDPVTVKFNEELDQLSVSLRSIEVRGPEGKVPGTLAISKSEDNSTWVKFYPLENLEYNSSYVLKIMETIRDLSGNRLEEERTINFVTEYPIVFIPNLNSPPFITHMFATRLDEDQDCKQRCFIIEARFIDTDKASEMRRVWSVDNQTIDSSDIIDFVISNTQQGDSKTELTSAVFLHDIEGNISLEVIDSDNLTDQRDLAINKN